MPDPIASVPSPEPVDYTHSNFRKKVKDPKKIDEQALTSIAKAKKGESIKPQTSIRRPADYSDSPRNLEKMVKRVKGTPDYRITEAKVHVPDDLASRAPELEKACLQDFKKAQRGLEHSIAEVALEHPDSIAFVEKYNQRVFELMRAYAEVLLEDEGLLPVSDAPPERQAAIKEAHIELKVNAIMAGMFSQTRPVRQKKETDSSGEYELVGVKARRKSGEELEVTGVVQEGIANEAGNVGMNPLAIRKVLKEGNLRERFYIHYKTLSGFGNELFKDRDKVERVNSKLKGWQVDVQQLKEMTNEQGPYDYGVYASKTKASRLREFRSLHQREQVAAEQNLPIAEDRRPIPLSYREKMMSTRELSPETTRLGSDLQKIYEDRAKEKTKWQSGKAWFTTPTSKENPNEYIVNREKLELEAIAGMSGVTDQCMTTAVLIGLNTRQDLEQLRLALLGWLIEAQDHSYHEIMMSSKTFGLDYHPSPDSYRDIYPGDADFAKKIERAQGLQGLPMPAECLQVEYVRLKAAA